VWGAIGRDEGEDRGEGDEAENGDGPERRSPTEGSTDGGADRHADDVRNGQPREDEGDSKAAAVLGDDRGRQHHCRAEECAVDEGDQHTGDEQELVAGGQRAEHIADGKDADIDQQQAFSRIAAGEGRKQGAPDGDT
jgi:hypothetical protein